MAIIKKKKKKKTDNKYWAGCGDTGACVPCGQEDKMKLLVWKAVWWSINILNIDLPQNPAILPPDTDPKEMKIHVHTKPCTQLFITGLFTLAKKGNNPNVH